jgi:hypothetical protein
MLMQKEEIISIAQLLSVIKELSYGLERAQKEKNSERLMQIKKEILSLQNEINKKIEAI